MTAEELLDEIKTRLNVTGDYHDSLLSALAVDVKDYIKSAGANPESTSAVGVIARGVADLWNFGSGEGKFSPVFYQRVSQIVIENEEVKNDEQDNTSTDIGEEGDEQPEPEMPDGEERPPLHSGESEGGGGEVFVNQ